MDTTGEFRISEIERFNT